MYCCPSAFCVIAGQCLLMGYEVRMSGTSYSHMIIRQDMMWLPLPSLPFSMSGN